MPGIPLAALLAMLGILLVGLLARDGINCPEEPRGTRRVHAWRVRIGFLIAGASVGLIVGCLHVARVHPAALNEAVEDGSVLRVDAVVSADPQQIRGDSRRRIPDGTATRSWVRARMTRFEMRGQIYEGRIPVVLHGEAVAELVNGQRIRISAKAGPSWDPASQGAALAVIGPPEVLSPPGATAELTNEVRRELRQAVGGMPADAAGLLLGLAIGDESLLEPALVDQMRVAGMSHLTAVSGSNTSIVAGVAIALAALVGLRWRGRITVALVVLTGYVFLVGPEPSVLRAAGMALVAMAAVLSGRRRRGPPALMAASLALLVTFPALAASFGFALSVAATAALILIAPFLGERFSKVAPWLPRPLVLALAVAVAAHVATLPLVALMGAHTTGWAIPANMAAAPLVLPPTVLGLVAAVLAPIAPRAATILAHAAGPFCAGIAWIAGVAAEGPELPGGRAALQIAAGAIVVGMTVRCCRRPRLRRALPAAVVLLGGVSALAGTAASRVLDGRWPPDGWAVLACDVGQGDAVLVRVPGSRAAVLVDVGPDPPAIAACLADTDVQRLTVVLTHFHADHVDGLAGVLGSVPVERLITTPIPEPLRNARAVVAQALQAGTPLHLMRAGESVNAAGVHLTALWPAREIAESPANNASLVLVAEVPVPDQPPPNVAPNVAPDAGVPGGILPGPGQPDRTLRVLLTGDVEPLAQRAIMASTPIDVDVVKVAHHGSAHQDPGFAAWALPQFALVTVGAANDYGHPSERTLDQFRAVGAEVGRTDVDGAVAIVATGGGLQMRRQR